MSFTVYYTTARPVTADERATIEAATARLSGGFAWLLCEPPAFWVSDDGRLQGGSKPNFHPHPEDVAAAAAMCGPRGSVETLLEVLCQVSKECGIDWELSHDRSGGPTGRVAGGVADPAAVAMVDEVAAMADAVAGLDPDEFDPANAAD